MTPEEQRQAAEQFKRGAREYAESLERTPIAPRNQLSQSDRQFALEYRAEPRYAEAMTEAEYIRMRRVDVGLDDLIPRPS
jgi:hypothetical protein